LVSQDEDAIKDQESDGDNASEPENSNSDDSANSDEKRFANTLKSLISKPSKKEKKLPASSGVKEVQHEEGDGDDDNVKTKTRWPSHKASNPSSRSPKRLKTPQSLNPIVLLKKLNRKRKQRKIQRNLPRRSQQILKILPKMKAKF
jgi:hypothetical protein